MAPAVTRRFFLKSSGLALAAFGAVPQALVRAVYAQGANPKGKTLVVVFQRGACDGLNTVIPLGEGSYRKLRPTIAVSPKDALATDGFFALHPALESLLPLWKEGSLAAVHAVGSPDPTRSHFDAQDFMESGTPGRKATDDGWMNRYLQTTPDPAGTPFRAVALTPTLPRSLAGRFPAVAVANLREFGLRRGAGAAMARGFEEMYAAAPVRGADVKDKRRGIHSRGAEDVLHGAGEETFDAAEFLRKHDPARYEPSLGVAYPRGRLGDSLRQIAQLLKADAGLEVAFTEVGGWDHHAAQGGKEGQLANRLSELALALAAFHRDLGPRMSEVVVVTLTEFGRTVRENGNRGTDHGHASVSFVLGGPVRGGKVYGRWPGLGEADLYEGRDLAVTTDFRDLLGELITGHLGGRDLAAVFPGHDIGPGRALGVLRA